MVELHGWVLATLVWCCACLPGCSVQRSEQTGRPLVVVSITPYKALVERIGGGIFDVEVLLPAGQSHSSYDPSPKQLARLTQARAFFKVGVGSETQVVDRLAEAGSLVSLVDLQQGIELMPMEAGHEGHQEEGHDHADCGEGNSDPHTWLDPSLVAVQCRTIADALSSIEPGHAEEFHRRAEEAAAEFLALDRELSKVLEPLKGSSIIVYHGAFNYFARRYGLEQVSIESGGREPGAAYLAQVVEEARRRHAVVVFTQPQYSPAPARAVADAIGGFTVELDSMGADLMKDLANAAEVIGKHVTPGGGR